MCVGRRGVQKQWGVVREGPDEVSTGNAAVRKANNLPSVSSDLPVICHNLLVLIAISLLFLSKLNSPFIIC